jgi:hypothetical protein
MQTGTPDATSLIEQDRGIPWPTMRVQTSVYNTERLPSGLPKCPTRSRCSHGAQRCADRGSVQRYTPKPTIRLRSHEARQQQEAAEVMGDLLAVERDESALVMRIDHWMEDYNSEHPHSRLGCRSPRSTLHQSNQPSVRSNGGNSNPIQLASRSATLA